MRPVQRLLRRSLSPELYVMNAYGTNPVRLTHFPGVDYAGDWSPNGKMITFTSSRSGGGNSIYVMGLDGTAPQSLFASGQDEYPSWSR